MELFIFEAIKEFGLTSKVNGNSKVPGEVRLVRPEDDKIPELEVVIEPFSLTRFHVIVNATPFDQKYHKDTRSPIRPE